LKPHCGVRLNYVPVMNCFFLLGCPAGKRVARDARYPFLILLNTKEI
jgi:hypothetical protein